MTDTGALTPYSTLDGMLTEMPDWAPTDQDNERIAAYTQYEKMYWSVDGAFKLIRRNEDGKGIYVPKPKMIVDTTAHYLLKGMSVNLKDPDKNQDLKIFLDNFLARERFYSRFQVAKLAGVARGDWVFHITADPLKPEGTRISMTSVDPALYFPEFDSDDVEKRTGAKLVEFIADADDPTKTVVKVLRYWHEYNDQGIKTSPLVWREEVLYELEDWGDPEKATVVKNIIPQGPLPADITQIPLYHFKNAEWDGFPFGNSELKGYERIFQAINQAISDEEIALALVGLGVYATDAGRPKNDLGQETDWIVAPGTVWEMPGATMVKRLEGITSVTPVLDHVHYLEGTLLDASGTSEVALGRIDAQTAESGIALALKFQPTLAKIEYRDTAGVEMLTQMWYDWKFWVAAYESTNFGDVEIVITLGEKLPLNRVKIIEELNNLKDRKIISKQYYRDQLEARLGYTFPDDIEQQIMDEELAVLMMNQQVFDETQNGDDEEDDEQPNQTGPGGRRVGPGDTRSRRDRSTSNNRGRVNESNGTEARS
jgi:hypothetical protein